MFLLVRVKYFYCWYIWSVGRLLREVGKDVALGAILRWKWSDGAD